MFKNRSKKAWLSLKKFSIPIVVYFLISICFFSDTVNAVTTPRLISGTITYTDGFAPEEGIWITMCAMGENGGTFTTDVLIREGDNTAEYSIPIDLAYANDSNSFIIKCEPQNATVYSSTIYSTLVEVTDTDATDIDFRIERLTERTVSGTITYTNSGSTTPGAIGVTVTALGDFDFATYVTIPEGCNQVGYTIPIDLNYINDSTSFRVQCTPEDTTNYQASEYKKLIDVYKDNVSNINFVVTDN